VSLPLLKNKLVILKDCVKGGKLCLKRGKLTVLWLRLIFGHRQLTLSSRN
jgi:hypothetical protein